MEKIGRKALKRIAEVGDVFTFEEALVKTGYAVTTLRKILRSMIENGLLTYSNNKYCATDKLKLIIEGAMLKSKTVDEKYAYIFTDEKGVPIPVKIDTIEKLYIAIKYRFIKPEIVLNHIAKGYLQKWLRETFNANELANKIDKIKDFEELLHTLETYIAIQ